MQKKFLHILSVVMIFSILLAGCSGVTENATELMRFYNQIYRTSFWTVMIVGLIASLVCALVVSAFVNRGGCVVFVIVLAVGMTLHLLFALFTAPRRAEHATTVAWEAAKDAQADYIQKIHGYWVAYSEEVHHCSYSSFSASGTGCKYVTEDCDTTCDDEGDCTTDCDYYPWFSYERTLKARLQDNWQRPEVTFASHLAPEDWKNNQYGGFWGGVPLFGASFAYQNPPEWNEIRDALNEGVVLPGSYTNHYSNWLHANDYDLYETNSQNIPGYEDAGLLPVINPLYGTYHYDMVQFSPGMGISSDSKVFQEWQNIAHIWGGKAGQEIQASLIVFFAKDSEVEDLYQWVNTSKAYLQQEGVHGKNILPKNMVLVMCTVDELMQSVTACQLETGMFEGNNDLKLEVSRMETFPFSTEAFFGVLSASYASELDENGWLVPEVTFGESKLGSLILDNFIRVEMAEKEYLRTNLSPTQDQMNEIQGAQILRLVVIFGLLDSFLIACIGVVVSKMI